MSQVQGEAHHVFLPVLLDHRADLCDDLNRAITHVLLFIVQQAVEKGKDRSADLLVTHFTEILRDEGDEWRKLI